MFLQRIKEGRENRRQFSVHECSQPTRNVAVSTFCQIHHIVLCPGGGLQSGMTLPPEPTHSDAGTNFSSSRYSSSLKCLKRFKQNFQRHSRLQEFWERRQNLKHVERDTYRNITKLRAGNIDKPLWFKSWIRLEKSQKEFSTESDFPT